MFKFKTETLDYKKIVENTYDKYLENLAKNGWILKSNFRGILIFKKEEPQDIKYQIEYQTYLDYEYADYLAKEGYELVSNFDNIIILQNYNPHAPDLHSDDNIRLEVLNKVATKQLILACIALALTWLPLYFIIWFFFNEPFNLGYLFETLDVLPFLLLLFFIFIIPIIIIIEFIIIKNNIQQCLKNQEPQFKYYNIINKISSLTSYVLMILFVLGIITLIYKTFINPKIMLFEIIPIIVGSFLINFSIKMIKKYRINQKLALFVFIILTAIIVGISQNNRDYSNTEADPIPTISSYMKEYNDYHEYDNLLIDTIEFNNHLEDNLNNNDYKEIVKTCLNSFIAKEVMKNDIIRYENETRATPEAIKDLLDKTGQYTTGDIPYYSFEDAFKNLKQHTNSLVDECYYNNHFMIARKDNKILISYMQDEDHYLENIIEHYFR